MPPPPCSLHLIHSPPHLVGSGLLCAMFPFQCAAGKIFFACPPIPSPTTASSPWLVAIFDCLVDRGLECYTVLLIVFFCMCTLFHPFLFVEGNMVYVLRQLLTFFYDSLLLPIRGGGISPNINAIHKYCHLEFVLAKLSSSLEVICVQFFF
jgi:hypothetical protein